MASVTGGCQAEPPCCASSLSVSRKQAGGQSPPASLPRPCRPFHPFRIMERDFPGACVQVFRARPFWAATAIALWLPSATLAASSSSDKKAEREALKNALVQVMQRTALKSARVSVQVQQPDDGTVVFTPEPDELLNPASNVKLYTAAAASRAGAEYRYETEFLVEPELPKDGKVKTLYVRGAVTPPSPPSGSTASRPSRPRRRREVQDIVVDDSSFDGERTPPGYDQEDSRQAYWRHRRGDAQLERRGRLLRPAEKPRRARPPSRSSRPVRLLRRSTDTVTTGPGRARRVSRDVRRDRRTAFARRSKRRAGARQARQR